MKRFIIIFFLFTCFFGYSQTEYLPDITWKTIVKNVVYLGVDTFQVDVDPIDFNDPGAEDREFGDYLIDNVGHIYTIIDTSSTTATVIDEFGVGVGPYSGAIGYVYNSVGDGSAPFIAPIVFQYLDSKAKDNADLIFKDIFWREAELYGKDSANIVWVQDTTSLIATKYDLDTISGGGESLWTANGDSIYYNGGNVGIGTSSPDYKLHVDGDVQLNQMWINASDSAADNLFRINNPQSGKVNVGWGVAGGANIGLYSKKHATRPGNYIFTYGGGDFGSLNFTHYNGASWVDNMIIDKDGKVGIGTTTPSEKLEIDGNIKGDTVFADAVGIGTSSPSAKLSVESNEVAYIASFKNSSTTLNSGGVFIQTAGSGNLNSAFRIDTGAGGRMVDITDDGYVQFGEYGDTIITGTVSTYAAFDTYGNLIEATGTSGSGDNWGSQTVVSDATIDGVGTSPDPLKVDTTIIATKYYAEQQGGGGGYWTDDGTELSPTDDENIYIGNSAPYLRFEDTDLVAVNGQEYRITQLGTSLYTQSKNSSGTWINETYVTPDNFNFLDDINVNGHIQLTKFASETAAQSGTGKIYADTDDSLYYVNTAGTATNLMRAGTGGSSYSLPLAADGTRGGLQIGYTSTANNFALQLSSEKGYVVLPDATTSVKGIASFSSDNFDVSSGAVTIKNLGVSMAEINATGTADNTTYLRGDGTWQTVSSGGDMVYPGAGIAVSTGSAWGTSITDNSSFWNTAYGWGDHAAGGYLTGNQTITLSGDITGSGATAITTTIASLAVEASMLNDNIISGKQAIPAALTSTDELLVSDGGLVRRMDVSVLETYMQDSLSFGGTWTEDTNGINYTDGNIGIGRASLPIDSSSYKVYILNEDNPLGLMIKSTLDSTGYGSVGLNVEINDSTDNSAAIRGAARGSSGEIYGGYFTAGNSEDGIGAYIYGQKSSLKIGTNSPPSSSTDNGTQGEIRFTRDYVYICTSTNTWKRIALSTW